MHIKKICSGTHVKGNLVHNRHIVILVNERGYTLYMWVIVSNHLND